MRKELRLRLSRLVLWWIVVVFITGCTVIVGTYSGNEKTTTKDRVIELSP